MTERANLTSRTVEALSAGAAERIVWDTKLSGFGVRVYPSGTRKFLIQYRNAGGQTRRMVLGDFTKLTADRARDMAKKHFAAVVEGEDPARAKQVHRASMTVADLCDAYMEACRAGLVTGRNEQPKKALTIYTDNGRIERHIKPLLGALKATDVVRADVERFKAGVVTGKTATDAKTKTRGRAIVTGGRGAATRTLGLLGAIFKWGIENGIVVENPVRGVSRFKDGNRKALLNDDQYRALGIALDTLAAKCTAKGVPVHHPYGLAAIRFIALSGVRKGEAIGLKWTELDAAGGCLRLQDSKTGESVRPLGAAAIAVAKGMEAISDNVFAAGPKLPGYQGLPRLWRLVQATARPEGLEAGEPGPLDEVTLHGLRHSFAGTADGLECSVPTIAAMLGHSLAGVTAGYVFKRLDKPLIVATDRVAGNIDRTMRATHSDSNVVAFEAAHG
jgi:integrase